MDRRTTWLLGILVAAAGLWLYSRTKSGRAASAAAADATGGAIGSASSALGSLSLSSIDWANITGGISDAMSNITDSIGLTQPRGIRNNNPGNIRYIADPAQAWNGQVGNDGGYGIYDTAAHGVRALGHQLMDYANRGLTSVAAIITTWAPAADSNNTAAYIADVSQQLGVNPTDQLDVANTLPQLTAAIIQHENGQQPYSTTDIADWVYS